MDKTLNSPSRENYEELDGLTEEEIESRVILCEVAPVTDVVKFAQEMFEEGFSK